MGLVIIKELNFTIGVIGTYWKILNEKKQDLI